MPSFLPAVPRPRLAMGRVQMDNREDTKVHKTLPIYQRVKVDRMRVPGRIQQVDSHGIITTFVGTGAP